MNKIKLSFWLLAFLAGILLQTAVTQADETALFTTSVAPDALILLDLSGSMDQNPAGGSNTWGDATCAGPTFYSSSGSGHTTACSKLAIAKRSIFDLLDDNNSGTIDSQDEASLGVRVGYMRYYNCSDDDTGGNYSSGCNSLSWVLNSRYSRVYCNSATSCTASSSASGSVSGESANGGTPLASALNEAKLYLDASKTGDTAAACRQKFAILITDGADTYACSGNGSEDQSDMYKRRRESVAKAKALADAGYKVFVVGFGAGMPDHLEKTLNWMAYYGGTDNPLVTNSGVTSAYNPASVTSCQASSTTQTGGNYFATSNDPGNTSLAGYAFLAADASQLADSLKSAMNIIREANYSFSQSSIQSSRTADENYLYEGSFQPVTGDPFWLGHLKKFNINADGAVGTLVWDAGALLQAAADSSRTINTYKSGALTAFTTGNITPTNLGVAANADRDAVVGYIRGNATYNQDAWKLGDVFRSTPITVGTPSAFFADSRDTSSNANHNNAFAQFRADHTRSSALGNRLILAGANDGQLHAFKTSDGSEAWSFIPPNFLPKLKNIAHADHPTSLAHSYFVDGPVTVADTWLGAGSGTNKSSADWQTILVFGEGRGGVGAQWSSSASCDSGFNSVYNATGSFTNYCGYYAFNLNDSLNPVYKWHLGFDSSRIANQAPYLGDPWSKIMTGRVLINGNERWVGFFGAGYNAANCAGGGTCDTRGKGFFVVDLTNGQILWSYTYADNAALTYSMPASPAIVDTDNDGFYDTVYLGDLGGSMWRFKMCTSSDASSCSTANWSGGQFFASASADSDVRSIYTTPAVIKDASGKIWVFWGTGDKNDPTNASAQERFFGLQDDRVTSYALGQLDNITSGTYSITSTNKGWYINLSSGEKVLSDSTVFGGVVYFTTFTPSASTDPCQQGGTANLYAISSGSGSGSLPGAQRKMNVGSGIPSAPIVSLRPGGSVAPDLYVTVSGGGSSQASTTRVNFTPPSMTNKTNMLYWRDQRLQ